MKYLECVLYSRKVVVYETLLLGWKHTENDKKNIRHIKILFYKIEMYKYTKLKLLNMFKETYFKFTYSRYKRIKLISIYSYQLDWGS